MVNHGTRYIKQRSETTISVRFVKILSRAIKRFFWSILIRSYQDPIKIYLRKLLFQALGEMFQVLREMSRSCMSYQGVSSSDSLGTQLTGDGT